MGVVYDKLLNRPLLHNHKTWYMVSPDASIWDVTIDDTGTIVTTKREPIVPMTGNPIGLLLSLTYA
jgi:hypothetical protein